MGPHSPLPEAKQARSERPAGCFYGVDSPLSPFRRRQAFRNARLGRPDFPFLPGGRVCFLGLARSLFLSPDCRTCRPPGVATPPQGLSWAPWPAHRRRRAFSAPVTLLGRIRLASCQRLARAHKLPVCLPRRSSQGFDKLPLHEAACFPLPGKQVSIVKMEAR